MSKLVLQMQITVDGFVGGPNGELDWIFRSFDDESTDWIVEHLWRAGAHIMGSRTFRDMAAYWPTSSEPFASPMNEIPKVVFSRTTQHPLGARGTTRGLEDARRWGATCGSRGAGTTTVAEEWASSRVAAGGLADEIARLKRETGQEILAHGGASFARSLVQAGLVDEYRLIVRPVVLGNGLPLFTGIAQPLDLAVVSATPFGSGAVAMVYRPPCPLNAAPVEMPAPRTP